MNALAPDIGDLVTYGQDKPWATEYNVKFRVEGWLYEVTAPVSDGTFMGDLAVEWWNERENPDQPRYRWCLREEATHLALYGVAGAIAPIGEVVREGGSVRDSWTAEHFQSYYNSAMARAKRGERIF